MAHLPPSLIFTPTLGTGARARRDGGGHLEVGEGGEVPHQELDPVLGGGGRQVTDEEGPALGGPAVPGGSLMYIVQQDLETL